MASIMSYDRMRAGPIKCFEVKRHLLRQRDVNSLSASHCAQHRNQGIAFCVRRGVVMEKYFEPQYPCECNNQKILCYTVTRFDDGVKAPVAAHNIARENEGRHACRHHPTEMIRDRALMLPRRCIDNPKLHSRFN